MHYVDNLIDDASNARSISKVVAEQDRTNNMRSLKEKHPNAFARWTESENDKLRDLYSNQGKTIEEVSAILGRTNMAVSRQLKKLLSIKWLLPGDKNTMPKWYNEYTSKFTIEGGKQSDIRKTYRYDRDQWIEYLCDSSFPSSFMAGYKIVKNLLENPVVAKSFEGKKDLRLADIGCGNGGATMGAITAIEEKLQTINTVEIVAYDHNSNARTIFQECLAAYTKHSRLCFNPFFGHCTFVTQNPKRTQDTFDTFNNNKLKGDFNFILCFKVINELIFNHNFDLSSAYGDFFASFAPKISERGFLVVLDVSMSAEKDEKGDYIDENKYGNALNKQGRLFITQHTDAFKAIIPIPCALVENGCNDRGVCKQQRLFSAAKGPDDKGRVFPATYNVITRAEFADTILKTVPQHPTRDYIIQERKDGKKYCCNKGPGAYFYPFQSCECKEGESYYDGYDLNSN